MKLSGAFDVKLREIAERTQADGLVDGYLDEEAERACLLVVDDEPEITRSLRELLRRDYHVLVANSADEALTLLERNPVSVILADQRMPNGSGAELLSRAFDVAPEVTRILFTGYSDISAVIEAVNQGQIYYYIAKPWKPEELQAVLKQGVERYRLVHENHILVDELAQANELLEERVRQRTERLRRQNRALSEARKRIDLLSRQDALTGLINRRSLDEALAREVERSTRYGSSLSLVMADIDNFKTVNDCFGHLVGDMVLQTTADTLRNTVRMTDLVGRYGGEEFLVLLPNTGLGEACALAERMRLDVERMPVAFRSEPVTGSFGVAEWTSGESMTETVERADKALYEAKRLGRNRVCAASAEETE